MSEFIIGIHGHSIDRFIPETVNKVTSLIETRILELCKLHKNVELVTGLCPGPETWAAKICIIHNIPVNIYMPYDEEFVLERFRSEELDEVNKIIQDSKSKKILMNGPVSNFKVAYKAEAILAEANHSIVVYDPSIILSGVTKLIRRQLSIGKKEFTWINPRTFNIHKLIKRGKSYYGQQ